MPRRFAFISAFALVAALAPVAPAQALSADVVISQVYGGGGNTGATYTQRLRRAVQPRPVHGVTGGDVRAVRQFDGHRKLRCLSNPLTLLSGTVSPGQYYLVQLARGSTGTCLCRTPDATGIDAMGATAGKVALVNSTTGLGCNGGTTPCSPTQLALIKDLVGYGDADFYEGAGRAPALTNTTAALRN